MKKSFIISMIITLITAAIAIWVIMTTEGEIPVNWNLAGEVDKYGSPFTLLMFPGIAFFTTLLMYFLPNIDPKGENIKKSGPLLPILMVLVAALMLGIQLFIVMAIKASDGFNMTFTMTLFVSMFIGIIFIILGHYMPRVKHNYMMGIRNPWTLYSEDVWNKTHKVSKNWLIAAGVLFLICIFLKVPYNLIIPFIFLAVILIGLVVYSYIAFAEDKKKKSKKIK